MSAEKKMMKLRLVGAALLCLGVYLSFPAGASAAAPKWSISLAAFPSSFIAGSSGDTSEGPGYRLVVENTGDAATTGSYTIEDELPADLTPGSEISVESGTPECEAIEQKVICSGTEVVEPGQVIKIAIPVNVGSGTSGRTVRNEATVEGDGVSASASARTAVGFPAWRLISTSIPTNLVPGTTSGEVALIATNVGGAATHGSITITDELPEGVAPTEATEAYLNNNVNFACTISGRTVTCPYDKQVPPGELIVLVISHLEVNAQEGTLVNEATAEGGSAAPASTVSQLTVSPSIPDFGFLSGEAGFGAPVIDAGGAASTQAGSHPFQLSLDFGWPSIGPLTAAGAVTGAGHVKDAKLDLPPGEIVNPNSTSVLCTEAQLLSSKCPDGSQIGSVTFSTSFLGGVPIGQSGLYNMVPPHGAPSNFGFDAGGFGIFVHIIGSLRSDGDYGLTGTSHDILSFGGAPILGFHVYLWGDPSNTGHDAMRGKCGFQEGIQFCSSEEESKNALLTAPVQCSGQPTVTRAITDSWEEQDNPKTASYQSRDLAGTPVSVTGCNQLQFEPSIEAKPTTNLADSPSGLDVTVHQPVNADPGGNSPAIMKDLRLVLPEGMSTNPSAADGLGACTEAQANVHSLSPSECPASSKLASVEVRTPLLDHPVMGALYLATPFDNPSGSLVALYLGVDDPLSGTVSNLAGRVQLDSNTGQLTTIFEQNPQLPIEDIKMHLFTGPRASLRTPPTCGTYVSEADLTPWSAPQTADAHPTDSFAIQATPLGGNCPAVATQIPNGPSFTAGTVAPQAGVYSPFVLKASRADGTRELSKIETTLAPGLVAKLAGIPYCTDAQLAEAESRNKPNDGALEQADPSCPSASQIGTVDVAAGAGITPLHVSGRAYLAGPYKGAPLSLVVITPAIAGPFDLGAVVVRNALQVNPETAQVKAVSDLFPRILDGIPLDIRSIAIELSRSQFTLNPTSCDPFKISGTLTSVAGQDAPVSSPFQVGGCSSLRFAPKLALTLMGSTKRSKNPAFKAVLTYPKGNNANIAAAQVTLPSSSFLDQSHIKTVCTRVQFAARACPAGSIYGRASAITPLLDQPLSGPVYLRSSSNKLPDLVADLNGQIEVTLDGKVDTGAGGGIRNTFQMVPDAPVSKFVLEMQGGKKGLLVNSQNLCSPRAATHATVSFTGQNGKVYDTRPRVHSSCKKTKNHHRPRKHPK